MGLIEESVFDFQSPKISKAKKRLLKKAERTRHKVSESRHLEGDIEKIFDSLLKDNITQSFYSKWWKKVKRKKFLNYTLTLWKRNSKNEIWYDEVMQEVNNFSERIPKEFKCKEMYPMNLTQKEKIFLFGFRRMKQVYLWFDGYGFYIGNKKFCREISVGRQYHPQSLIFNYFLKKHGGLFFKAADKMYLREVKIQKYLEKENKAISKKFEKYLVMVKI